MTVIHIKMIDDRCQPCMFDAHFPTLSIDDHIEIDDTAHLIQVGKINAGPIDHGSGRYQIPQ